MTFKVIVFVIKLKPLFDDLCLKLLTQRKQDTLQWLQSPREINWNILNYMGLEAIRHFRNEISEK